MSSTMLYNHINVQYRPSLLNQLHDSCEYHNESPPFTCESSTKSLVALQLVSPLNGSLFLDNPIVMHQQQQ